MGVIEDLLAGHPGSEPAAVGISTGGQINTEGNIIGGTGMLSDWVGFPLREKVSERTGLPVYILNDGHAAALAEAEIGAGKDHQSVLCVVAGTGLGGGWVIDGQLQHGDKGLAGSVGQFKVSIDGEVYVPLEDLVSGPGLLQAYNNHPHTELPAETAEEVAVRAAACEEAAVETIRQMGEWLGLGLSHALHTFDASSVVVGGSVAQIGPLFFESARASLRIHGHSTVGDIPILPASLGPRAGLIGAALFAMQQRGI